MRKDKSHLPAGLIEEKVSSGPISEIPGPTFPKHVATEETATSKLGTPIPVMITEPSTKTNK